MLGLFTATFSLFRRFTLDDMSSSPQLAYQFTRASLDDVPGIVVIGDVGQDLTARAQRLSAHGLGALPQNWSDHPPETAKETAYPVTPL